MADAKLLIRHDPLEKEPEKKCSFKHELYQDKDDLCPVCDDPLNPDF